MRQTSENAARPRRAEWAVLALAAHPSKQDLTTIERLASKERDLNVRKQAARILVAHATSDMLATFRGMLSAPDAELRALAALGLAKSSS